MLSRREEKLLRGLRQRKIREAEGLFLAEGVRVVEDLLASEHPVRLLVAASFLEDNERGERLLEEARRRGVRLVTVAPADLDRFADTQSPQGVVAVAAQPRATLDELLRPTGPCVVLALDGIQDPGNFGTLARTAEALGANGVLALPGTVDAWNPKAVRAAAGSTFRIPVVSADWAEAGPWFHERGFQILAAAADGEPLGEERPDRALLVVGNEGAGLGTDTQIYADRTITIPMRGRAESLNVAVAAAILLHELLGRS